MKVRRLQDGDYENILTGWWDQWTEWTAPKKSSLPDNGNGGFIVSSNDVDVCAGFLYTTNSSMAWCEYIISDKSYTGSDRGEAIELLIETITKQAKELGFEFIFTVVKHPVLKKRYERCGYLMDQGTSTEMIKIL